MKKLTSLIFLILLAVLVSCQPAPPPPPTATQPPPPTATDTPTATPTSTITPTPTPTEIPQVIFAVIGDYGDAGSDLAAVAALIYSWHVDFIITTGDNNYPEGSPNTIDENIGQYFHSYISPYQGEYGPGADINRFFPSLGNHDWLWDDAQPYLDYFQLPGNERYYDFQWDFLHFFALDSDNDEPDGVKPTSTQGEWLQTGLAASTAAWQIVYFHHAPYSSGHHGPTTHMQWPFREWGADVVLSGHDHHYERLLVDGLAYFIVGNCGNGIYSIPNLYPGSQVRYNADYGAMRVTATPSQLTFEFFNIDGELIDRDIIQKGE